MIVLPATCDEAGLADILIELDLIDPNLADDRRELARGLSRLIGMMTLVDIQ
ncbi:hypothetical protein [Mesorhizobium sp. CAU 1741]|uniref:hypothetical protein n=1 Tax=Mesorhizobium sp. CAU 1741 TaxID=3140366 RepID=UPI00325B760E